MAGVRPDTRPKVNVDAPFIAGDALFVTNTSGDRNVDILELQRTMRDGSGLETVEEKEELTFATRSEMKNLHRPLDGNYRIKDGRMQIINASTQLYHEIWIEADRDGNPVFKWAPEGEE